MTDHLDKLNKLREYMGLWIYGNIPTVQTEYNEKCGGMRLNLFMNAPISFQEWLTYPYETKEEQEKNLIA